MSKYEITLPVEDFTAIWEGKKKFLLNENDKELKVGDRLTLKEFANEKYTGDEIHIKITYIEEIDELVENYVILGFK